MEMAAAVGFAQTAGAAAFGDTGMFDNCSLDQVITEGDALPARLPLTPGLLNTSAFVSATPLNDPFAISREFVVDVMADSGMLCDDDETVLGVTSRPLRNEPEDRRTAFVTVRCETTPTELRSFKRSITLTSLESAGMLWCVGFTTAQSAFDELSASNDEMWGSKLTLVKCDAKLHESEFISETVDSEGTKFCDSSISGAELATAAVGVPLKYSLRNLAVLSEIW